MFLDAAVGMATATPFLGEFAVPNRVRVGFASGESGRFTLKETCLRILQAKGIDPDTFTGWLKWEFTLPTLTDTALMTDFAKRLVDLGIAVAFIDPLYLCLGSAVDPRSVFSMGNALKAVSTILLDRNITPIICHHANRKGEKNQPMTLEDLSHAGLAEFARQWILLARISLMTARAVHDLWLTIGGSAGHGGL